MPILRVGSAAIGDGADEPTFLRQRRINTERTMFGYEALVFMRLHD